MNVNPCQSSSINFSISRRIASSRDFSVNTATVSYKWGKKGIQPKVKSKQRGKERRTAMGSYNFETGQITVSFHEKGNCQSLKKHLKKIAYTYRNHSKIIVVLDNVRFHHANLLKKWLLGKPQLELVYLLPYSPELNPIERAWWYMRKKITHNRYFILKNLMRIMIHIQNVVDKSI